MARDEIDLVILDVTDPPRTPSSSLNDDAHLRRLGKRPLLNRSFGFMSILGLTCSSLLSWEATLVSLVPGLLNGGPAGLIWGLLANWIGMISIYAVVAELASMAPTAGGQYHWVAMMAPQSCSAFLSYLTAWLVTLGWQASALNAGYGITTLLQGIIVLVQPSYKPLPWHTVLILWGVMLLAILLNSITSRALMRFEGLVLVAHIIGFFGVLIPLVYFAPHNDPVAVFTTFNNQGNWPTQTLSFFVGLPNIATTLIGGDCAVHMSEEIQSASIVVPQAIMCTMFINGFFALAMIIALMFCLHDTDEVLASSETAFYPFLRIFSQGVHSTIGATIMAGIILVLGAASIVGVCASASRMLWSFSRDRGLPFDRYLVRLNSHKLPIVSIFATLAATMLLSLITLKSAIAQSAILTLIVSALFSSYLLISVLLLWRRTTGAFQPFSDDNMAVYGGLTWGPWKLPEPLGVINNAFACLYIVLLLFWSFWPQTNGTTLESFNWSVLVFGAVALFSIAWYMLRARHYFRGPIKEI